MFPQSVWSATKIDVMRRKETKESEKAGSRRESDPGHLGCAAICIPLSYNSQTTAPAPTILVLHRWD